MQTSKQKTNKQIFCLWNESVSGIFTPARHYLRNTLHRQLVHKVLQLLSASLITSSILTVKGNLGLSRPARKPQ